MTYKELKKRIKEEKKDKEYISYISYSQKYGEKNETLISNFLDDNEVSEKQLFKAVEEGLLEKDWDTFLVIK